MLTCRNKLVNSKKYFYGKGVLGLMKNFIFEPYKGNDISYTYTISRTVQGLYIHNFDKVNPLNFTVNGIEYPLEPQQSFRDVFCKSFNFVTVSNQSSCVFVIGGLE